MWNQEVAISCQSEPELKVDQNVLKHILVLDFLKSNEILEIGQFCNCPQTTKQAHRHVKGVTTSTSYEYELRVSENKVQLMRIRDENSKFRSNSVSILNVTFA